MAAASSSASSSGKLTPAQLDVLRRRLQFIIDEMTTPAAYRSAKPASPRPLSSVVPIPLASPTSSSSDMLFRERLPAKPGQVLCHQRLPKNFGVALKTGVVTFCPQSIPRRPDNPYAAPPGAASAARKVLPKQRERFSGLEVYCFQGLPDTSGTLTAPTRRGLRRWAPS